MTFRVLGERLPVDQIGGLEFYPQSQGTEIPLTIQGLQLWLRGDLGTFQDSAKTTGAVNDGDVIGAWDDRSGKNRDVLQSTTVDKPTLRLNVRNGKPIIRFDGVSDFLQASYADIAQPYVRFVVLESDGGNLEHIINSVDSNSAVIFVFNAAGVKFHIFAGSSIIGPLLDTNWHILTGVFNGASSSIRLDGSATLGDAGVTAIDGGATIGALNTGAGNFFGGDIAEVLDYTNINTSEIELIEQYLSDRYGITLS